MSEYWQNKFDILTAISEGYDNFIDILSYVQIEPVRIRGILRYFLVRGDIRKYQENPSLYEMTEKGFAKLCHWQNKYVTS